MHLKIDRRRVGPNDGLVDVSIDGRMYGSASATDLLICNALPEIRRFPYYMWSPEGLFRHGKGKFRYYFQKKDDPKNDIPKVAQSMFLYDVDFEHDTKEHIFTVLNYRLSDVTASIRNHVDVPLTDERLNRYAYEQFIEGDIE